MPILKLKHVVSFSSEDLKHPAENLLKSETYFKWKCATAGERQLSVVVQLEKASKIHSLDIGNNGSAFVEVLVGRSTWKPSEEFKVLLVASSFMSPIESKAYKELSRVRMFGLENFTKAVSEEKWDLVKFVCTQPYNQNETYGLSFVNIHSPPEPSETVTKEKTIKLGRFKLKSASDDEEDTITTGSFFRQQSQPKVNQTPNRSMAAACRDARSNVLSPASTTPSTYNPIKTKGEASSMSTNKINISSTSRDSVAISLLQSPAPGTPKRTFPKMKETEKVKRKIESENPPQKKAKVEKKAPKKPKKKKKLVAYNKILNDVVFGLSGFENPERGQIRDLALSMGAEYSPSWNNRSTHLICAFINTPKYNQVKGRGGKIVKKNWIKECHKEKRRLNTKSFRMDGRGDSSYESTGDDDDDDREESSAVNNPTQTHQNKVDRERKKSSSSECDTEDELEKLRNETKKDNPPFTAVREKDAPEPRTQTERDISEPRTKTEANTPEPKSETKRDTSESQPQIEDATKVSPTNVGEIKVPKEDAYDCSTDDEEIQQNAVTELTSTTQTEIVDLPDFFEDKHFMIYGNIDVKDRRLLRRYITAYGGTLLEYMGNKVNYVISSEDWDQKFDQALEENKSLVFIRPSWIFKCHEKQKFIEYASHCIKKD